jgi:hypothetical protein
MLESMSEWGYDGGLGLAQPATGANDSSMDERAAAQAMELVRALRDQLHKMIHQLVRLDRQNVTGTNSRASAIRCEAAALRLDISQAQILIDRLRRRYLNSDGHAQPRRPARHQALAEPVVAKVK